MDLKKEPDGTSKASKNTLSEKKISLDQLNARTDSTLKKKNSNLKA